MVTATSPWAVCPGIGSADWANDGAAPATINRRLAALRSLVKLARTLGLIPWVLEVDGLRTEAYRDTRGPGQAGFRKLLETLAGRSDGKAVRDRALLRLLYDLGLRRAEVVGLDVDDLDLAAGRIAVLGKGRTQKVALSLPRATHEALAAWLAVRGAQPGPLFMALDRVHRGTAEDRDRQDPAFQAARAVRFLQQHGRGDWPLGNSRHHPPGVFQVALERVQKGCCWGAIDHPMVEGQAEEHHRPLGDLSLIHHRLLDYPAHP